jgi:hypothetical protein
MCPPLTIEGQRVAPSFNEGGEKCVKICYLLTGGRGDAIL